MIKISGGIVCSENGNTVIYQPKCDLCETVDPNETLVNLTSSVIEVSTWRCIKCGYNQLVKIQNKPFEATNNIVKSNI